MLSQYDVEAWYLRPEGDYEHNPSVLEGMPVDEVHRARHEACRFIQRIGEHLRLYPPPHTPSPLTPVVARCARSQPASSTSTSSSSQTRCGACRPSTSP